jgi:hypothetical protein
MADTERDEQEAAWSAEWLDGEHYYEKLVYAKSSPHLQADSVDMWEVAQGIFTSC